MRFNIQFPFKGAIEKCILLLTLLLISCGKDQDGLIQPISAEISSFSFLVALNPTLNEDLNLTFDGENTFLGAFDYVCDIENLVASFEFVGDVVSIDNVIQESSLSLNDFTEPVEYTVSKGAGSSVKNYFIEISYVTDYPIEMKSFSFLSELNPTLTQDVNLTFDGVDTFSAAVNELCDIEQLVASYDVVGGLVQVNSIEQTTGISSNDFNKPVTYKVANTTNSTTQDFYIEISYFKGLPRILINTDNAPIVSK